MDTQPFKLTKNTVGRGHILFGREMPRHVQIAWGRHAARLAVGARDCGLWLRDLPLGVADLAHIGFAACVNAAREELTARGVPVHDWPNQFLPAGMTVDVAEWHATRAMWRELPEKFSQRVMREHAARTERICAGL